jgi:DNA-binding NarL/FixJ family response regulator
MKDRVEETARIFMIDNHPALRQGLKRLFSRKSHIVCGEAGNRVETFERIGSSAADMALLDISLAEENGIELIAGIRELGISVLVYSMIEDADTVKRAFSAGANGYVTRQEKPAVLIAAVSDLLSGRRYISPRAARSLAEMALPSPDVNRKAMLSGREKEVLSMLGQGDSNADIAAVFAISARTVETYFARLITKLKLDGMKELRRYAIRNKEA